MKNFKKPRFWMVIVAAILVVAASITLITKPKDNKEELSFLNIDNAVTAIYEKGQLMMVNEDNSGCFISSTQLFKALDFKGWQEKKVSSHYEFSPSITVCINNGTGYKIRFYESEPKLAMVLYGDKYRYYTLPKDNYSNLYIMCMASSYYIPKEVVELVTSYKKVNFESSSEFSYVEKHTKFSIRNECYSIYEKNGKYYCENENKDINEVLEDVYYRGLKAVEEYGFTREYEESKNTLESTKNVLEPTIPKWSQEQSIGADMAVLDFASNDKVIFHGYFGLYVYDLNKLQIVRSLDLGPINCTATQGDETCIVDVSVDGNIINLHPINSESMYVYNVLDNTLYETDYKLMENPFSNFVPIKEAVDSESGKYSYEAVAFESGEYGYLYNYDGTIGTLEYVKSDMGYELFGFMEEGK